MTSFGFMELKSVHFHGFLFILTKINMKSGQPMIALTTPTGRPNVPSLEASVLAKMRNIAPNAADAGRRYLESDPTKRRAIWGPTKPMNPMVPQKHTTVAVMRDTMTIRNNVVDFGATPRVCDMFVPADRTLIFFASNIRTMKHTTVTARGIGIEICNIHVN